MLFNSQRKTLLDCELNAMMDSKDLTTVSSTKFLGVHTDEHVAWKEHINFITKHF